MGPPLLLSESLGRIFRVGLTQHFFLASAELFYPPARLKNLQPRKNAISTATAMPMPISHLVLTLIINLLKQHLLICIAWLQRQVDSARPNPANP
jgi:hypothetical protein